MGEKERLKRSEYENQAQPQAGGGAFHGNIWHPGALRAEYPGFLRGTGPLSGGAGGPDDRGISAGHRAKDPLQKDRLGDSPAAPFGGGHGL